MDAVADGAMAPMLSPERVSALRHDLRTPVNHIVGYCELLLEDADGPEHAPRRALLRDALDAVHDALSLINTALPSTGNGVTHERVEALYAQLHEPRARIMTALAGLVPPDADGFDDAFAADIARIRDATAQLTAARRPTVAVPTDAGVDGTRPVPVVREPVATADGRILVVDDQQNNRDVLERHLARQGYTVECAPDGQRALAALAQGTYDLVLLDVQMPGLDGHEVLRRIKHDPAMRDTPVVMISAADELTTIAACIEGGADDFLPKPFDPVILRARVSACTEKKRLRDLEIDYLHQVERVAAAATAVENGTYQSGSLASIAARDDALGRLARVFDAMAAGVRIREERLREHVTTLRREINAAQRGTRAGRDAVEGGDDGLIPGEMFANRYQVIRVVGRGGMGRVYKAHDRELGEDVAIKMLHRETLSGDPTIIDRFKTEIRLARRISHRNVVRTHDLGEADGAYYVTMEYVEGITLRDLIDMRDHLPVAATLGIAQQLAASLEVAHEQGVIHRDVKPQNLLLDADGVLKVMDFGIARLADRTIALTQAGMVIGTPAYMAPEQLLDEEVDARSDLYAAGVVLYECLTGALPFEGSSPIALIAKVLNTTPRAPAARDPAIPPALSALVMRLLDKDPAMRPASARELQELLGELG